MSVIRERQVEAAAAVVDVLLRKGLVSDAMLARARAVLPDGIGRLDHALAQLGLVPDLELARAYAEALSLPLCSRDQIPESPYDWRDLNPRFLRQALVLPLEMRDEEALVAFADPLNEAVRRAATFALGLPVTPLVASRSMLEEALDRLLDGGERDSVDIVLAEDAERLRDLANEGPVIRTINNLLDLAVELDATDLHIEPMVDRVKVRLRIDGMLRDLDALPKQDAGGLVSRIKIMAGLDIGERRLAQDGRIRQTIRGRDLDLRVAISPTSHGECAVLRLLDMARAAVQLSELGFRSHLSESLGAVLEQPHGILLVTGPTGSGKTTTLYAGLSALNQSDRKILTAEDPIEYLLDGICQTQIRPAIGLTFASALRSFLRQDPDIIMIGEIRDGETAEIAVQAALTGHLVLSTLHTNDAAGAVPRLTDMGIDPFLLTASLSGVLAQRLVRTLCSCKRHLSDGSCEAVGCPNCGGTGYRGRTAIGEFLAVSDRIRGLIRDGASAPDLSAAARAEGMIPITEDGLALVAAGITTREEIFRVSLST